MVLYTVLGKKLKTPQVTWYYTRTAHNHHLAVLRMVFNANVVIWPGASITNTYTMQESRYRTDRCSHRLVSCSTKNICDELATTHEHVLLAILINNLAQHNLSMPC